MTAARPTATGAPGYSETMPCEPESARRARQLVAAALSTWGVSELADVGELIVSELVNNSVNHTNCRAIRVLIRWERSDMVRIGVADKSRDVPVLGKPNDEAEEGRGLLLIDSMSQNWGYDRMSWGKVVWAELRATPAGTASVNRSA
ncbi:ATP-binding protein [Streptomyces sp. NPDC001127]|uniref:ATP-binding protein n=1 Tax=Streptomyces sp. NPDC001127 TaxID=3154377 RepID=UPI00331CF633